MARNRMIKPEFWTSETLMRISLESRLLFIGLWNFCDDYGFCLNNTRQILGNVFPIDENVSEDNIKKWLNELIQINVVIPLEYNTKKLLFIKSWGEHQTVQHKSKRSFIESSDLEQVIKDTLNSHEDLVRHYLYSHVPKRKKKGKEKVKEKVKYLDCVFLFDDERKKLVDKYQNEINLNSAIEILNNYKESTGKTYKSDYHTMIGWVFKKFNEDNPGKIITKEQFSNDIGLNKTDNDNSENRDDLF